MANMAASTVKCRITGSTGDPEDCSAANVRTIIDLDAQLEFEIDGAGVAITTGAKSLMATIPFTFVVSTWRVLGIGGTGSIVIDGWLDTYANYPPVVGDSIFASAKPTITTATKAESSTLTGWTTTWPKGSVLELNVDSNSTFTKAIVTFIGKRSS
jgi:hypothetical protein